mmetsp:Transcript_10435/g.18899  ORF Transcript_10435/g.18899 Transcript_10435/m.18899 type:complete len:229 (-) Transcript_10435:1594-2280(-)
MVFCGFDPTYLASEATLRLSSLRLLSARATATLSSSFSRRRLARALASLSHALAKSTWSRYFLAPSRSFLLSSSAFDSISLYLCCCFSSSLTASSISFFFWTRSLFLASTSFATCNLPPLISPLRPSSARLLAFSHAFLALSKPFMAKSTAPSLPLSSSSPSTILTSLPSSHLTLIALAPPFSVSSALPSFFFLRLSSFFLASASCSFTSKGLVLALVPPAPILSSLF